MNNKVSTKSLVIGAVLMAIVIVLQLAGAFVRLGPFSISLVLVPIVIGAAYCGPWMGAWLGAVFGVSVFISGDAATFLAINPLGTVAIVMAKGILAGLFAGLVYRLLAKFNRTVAVIAAAIVCPVANTGIFLLGSAVAFMDTMKIWASGMGFGNNVIGYMFLGLVGANFLVELAFNIVLSPIIIRFLNIRRIK